MVIVYSIVLLATAGTAGAYLWMKKPGLIVKTFMRYFLYTSGLRVKQVQVGRYKMTYAERGVRGDWPSLLLVHGFSSSKDMWVPVVRRLLYPRAGLEQSEQPEYTTISLSCGLQKLPRDMHIIVVDLPGHGDSSIPEDSADISLPSMVKHLKQFADVVGLTKRPFHLAGCSMGGALSALYAADYPVDLDKVTLVCPAMRTPEETQFQKEVREGVCRLLPQTAGEFQDMMDMCSYKKVKLSSMILEGCVQLRLPKNDFYKQLFDSMVNTDNTEEGRRLEEKTAQIDVGTQVMWGKHDEVMHISGVDRLRDRLTCLERVDILDKCGHSCSMERPGLVAKLLLAFRNQSNLEEGRVPAQL